MADNRGVRYRVGAISRRQSAGKPIVGAAVSGLWCGRPNVRRPARAPFPNWVPPSYPASTRSPAPKQPRPRGRLNGGGPPTASVCTESALFERRALRPSGGRQTETGFETFLSHGVPPPPTP